MFERVFNCKAADEAHAPPCMSAATASIRLAGPAHPAIFLLSLPDHATGSVATRRRSRTPKPAQTSIKKRAAGEAGLHA
ncbi:MULTISPECIES: hypothetical protein [Paraburkholderia]|uniref:hypothetical protein n=1 Tax=Paraburkholderia TaxID=1822464 RepID=UPI0013A6B324|nr:MULTISPECIES: hypothetical protein [Paraburkholderia]MDH6151058.1 hypothetical protein [Paraburkholderia sp. WSM4179]